MKRIPETDLNVSEYCLGTMYFGTKVGKSTSFRLLDIFAGMGGNFLDSANKYASWVPGFSGGESETVIGQWLKTRNRTDFIVTSKVGFPYGDIPRFSEVYTNTTHRKSRSNTTPYTIVRS